MQRGTSFLSPALALLILGGVIACAPPEEPAPVAQGPTEEEDLSAIRASVADFIAAYNGDDPEAFVALFSSTAMRLPPNAPELDGIDAIRNNTIVIFDQFEREVTVHLAETRFSGDFAVSRGTWAVRLTPKSGGEPEDNVGKWLNLHIRSAGGWLIERNIWNSDIPLDS